MLDLFQDPPGPLFRVKCLNCTCPLFNKTMADIINHWAEHRNVSQNVYFADYMYFYYGVWNKWLWILSRIYFRLFMYDFKLSWVLKWWISGPVSRNGKCWYTGRVPRGRLSVCGWWATKITASPAADPL